MQLLIASSSKHKHDEFRRIFVDSSVSLCIPTDLGASIEVEESGTTFAQNAALKAIGYAQHYGCWAISDDSGLEIDALHGQPGIYSSRFAGADATDDDRNEKVLHMLRNVGQELRSARYRCAIAVADQTGAIVYTIEATVDGEISMEPIGHRGFGYDPIFLVTDRNRTMAELTNAEKDVISHRGKAGRAACAHLEDIEEGTSSKTPRNRP